jgi:IS5 family transposase
VEAGSNTSTVTLRVVGGDEKGSLRTERVKYGRKSRGSRTRERLRWQEPTAHTKDRPVLSSERATHGIKNVTVRRIPYSERKKNVVVSPGWVLYTKTDWPTDRRS